MFNGFSKFESLDPSHVTALALQVCVAETRGRLTVFKSASFQVLTMSVVIVKTVVTPSATRAGVAFRLSQNDTHDMITINPDGI